MPRPRRIAPAGVCFHVLNRGNNRKPLFRKKADYAAFLAVVTQAVERFEMDLFCWCLMPNQWHLVLRPRTNKALSQFMAWLSVTHVRRHQVQHPSFSGNLYQGRYKSFPVEADGHFLALCRYVESNPRRAKLVDKAELWEWCSLRQRQGRAAEPRLAEWPVSRPPRWTQVVKQSMTDADQGPIESSLRRDSPLGTEQWSKRLATKLELRHKLNPIGRPRRPLVSLSKRQRQRRKKVATTK